MGYLKTFSELEQEWAEEHAMLTRLLALRRKGMVGTILAEGGMYWLSDGPLTDVWGAKVRYSKPALLELVQRLEALPDRRGAGQVCRTVLEEDERRSVKAV